MQFKTELEPELSKSPISHDSKILSIGSCFSSNISQKLLDRKFNIWNNPYGTIYNPISIFDSLNYFSSDFDDLYLTRDEMWVNYKSHFDLRAYDINTLKEKLNKTSQDLKEYLSNCSHLILTLGNSKVFTLKINNEIVTNCHKVKNDEFESQYLEIADIIKSFDKNIETVLRLNPEIKIILSVSPVRYLSDGLEMNQYSKSILRIACQKIVEKYNFVHYFPSYEIFMDDLRDYRFYNADLVHPNQNAIEYVWEKFQKSNIDTKSVSIIKKVEKINRNLNHHPFNPKSQNYKALLQNTLELINSLSNKENFENEIALIESKLNQFI